jgi:hypothetical protein
VPRLLLLLALLGLALLGAGCGDDDEPGAGPPPAPAPATTAAPPAATAPAGTPAAADRYRARLRRQCRRAAREAEGLPDPRSTSASALAAYFREVARLVRRKQRAFRAIAPPPRFADEHRASLRLGEEVSRLVEKATRDFGSGVAPDRVLAALGPRLERVTRRSNRIAAVVGVRACRVDPLT